MKTASVSEIKAHLGSYLKKSAAEPVVVTHKGKAIAVLIGVDDEEDIERLVQPGRRTLRDVLEAAQRRIDEGAGISHEDFWRRVEARNRTNGTGSKRKRGGK